MLAAGNARAGPHHKPLPVRRLIIIFTLVCSYSGVLVSGKDVGVSTLTVGLPLLRTTEFTEAPISGPVSALAETSDGTRWVGSNRLAAYDGVNWKTVVLPNAYAFRGLASDLSGRLWVGAIGALGYLARDDSGAWRFASLLNELQRDGGPSLGDIWHVCSLGHGAVFVTTEWILRWNGQKFDFWRRPGRTRLFAYSRGNHVVIYQDGVGLLRLDEGGDPLLEIAEADLPEHPLTWHVSLPDGAALLGLADSAYRRATDGKLTALPELSAKLRDSIPSCAVRLRNNLVAIGTFKEGIIFTNAAGTLLNAINETRGLGDDSVYCLDPAPDGTLAVGLGSSAVRIEPPDEITAYDGRSGFKGTPIKVLFHQGTTYALTNKTVYAFTPSGPVSTLGPEPRFWDAAVVGNNLWVSGFGGLWRKEGASWIHEYHVSGDVFRVAAVTRLPHTVVFFENDSLKALESGPYGWFARDLGQSVADTPLSLLEDAGGDLWVSTLVKGIYRFAWSTPQPSQTPVLHLVGHYQRNSGLPPVAEHPRLVRLGRLFFAFCDDEILQLNPEGTVFRSVPELGGLIGLSATPRSMGPPATAYWLVQSRLLAPLAAPAIIQISEGTVSDSRLVWKPIRATGLRAAQRTACIDALDAPEGSALWVGQNSSVLRIVGSGLGEESGPPTAVLQAVQNGEEHLPLNASLPAFPSKTHNLAFYFRVKESEDARQVFYQTQLSPSEREWSAPSASPVREYQGLTSGSHTLLVRAVDRFGRAGEPARCVFTISTPAYRHPFALGAYGLAAAAGGIGLSRWRLSRLRRQNARLNELVTERTRELELSNTAKSEFIENVSHEIRNPLNGLTGMLDLLQNGDLKPPERELARSLKACADTLARVSEEVLGYSKIEYGYVALHPKPFRVVGLLNELVDLFQLAASQAGTTMKIDLAEGFVDGFFGDEDKIRTILGNFIGNALKYAPGSRVLLTAEALPSDGGMVDLFFEVTDDGPGIPPGEQELIFQKFIRGSTAKESQIPGTGLGLATCRMLAKAINGSVGMETPSTGGATFYLRVMVARTAPPSAPETVQAIEPMAAGQRALIVDDEPYNRMVLRGIALELGLAPTLTATAQEAISALSTDTFEIVFLDWELPGAKGSQVARHLREQSNGARAIVVATTAHDSDEIRRSCLESGMDGFLLKPYSKERIHRLLEDLRSRRAGGQVEPVSPSAPPVLKTETGLNLEAFTLYSLGTATKQADPRRDYIAAVEEELGLLRRHLTSGKIADRIAAAHRLRALAGLIGAQDLSRLAGQLETERPVVETSFVHDLTTTWERLKTQLG